MKTPLAAVTLAALALAAAFPIAKTYAQEKPKNLTLDGAETVTITNGAASITLKKDGTIVLKGTDIVLDRGGKTATIPPSSRLASEIF